MDVKAREGDLYRVIRVFGCEFALYYGYYDERERQSQYSEPIPIYPDFHALPRYTADGYPFVTAMQDACRHFTGAHAEDGCHGCAHYRHGEEFLGICCHRERRQCPKTMTEHIIMNKRPNNNMEETNA